MLRLLEVNEENWLAVRRLSVREEQEGFLDSALGILARGYVYRAERARVIAVAEEDTILGLALVKDLDEEPACYDLQQFFIDRAYQGQGYGTAALGLILEELGRERKYGCVEVCVKREDAAALRVYEKCGFQDTGYVDEDAPDCLNLMFFFP
ncbi:MAG: GNAT family N-acetyltransferase [Oscillospiraceae bacterium]|nr:GNAT family N-acetyltransferase [Oscillospiraceae bacterium]